MTSTNPPDDPSTWPEQARRVTVPMPDMTTGVGTVIAYQPATVTVQLDTGGVVQTEPDATSPAPDEVPEDTVATVDDATLATLRDALKGTRSDTAARKALVDAGLVVRRRSRAHLLDLSVGVGLLGGGR